ncbi:hypothetical protein BKA82DRAFT_139724 [Pisolithus tinctorius]|uniref:Complex 1 LYR protein domain-containing protein n=1 Tax=Pisolithus tinctorius Marx 270 TaxID=870435 RepID=A0A0C3NCS9_PISTI|nr:hypothetical protein BKA82DRAFT_139724 [Pisolithus tinctorius]KIN93378.1 hypothetical protein M404DRAFT_171337 [Pisolithus tinctorius Marx 270]
MSAPSGLQKEVLALYRRALRMVRTKPSHTQDKFSLLVRYMFHVQASAVSPRKVSAIEHLLRRGRRQIELFENPSIRDCHISQDMREWERSRRKYHSQTS